MRRRISKLSLVLIVCAALLCTGVPGMGRRAVLSW